MPVTDRRLRVRAVASATTPSLEATQSLDAISNPFRLANELITLNADRDSREYVPYLRCSSLHDVCPREHILGWRNGLSYKRYVNASMLFTFEFGHAWHYHVQNDPAYFADRLIGWWRCRSCGHVEFAVGGSCPVANVPLVRVRLCTRSIRFG